MENNFSRYEVRKETEVTGTSNYGWKEHKLSSIIVCNYQYIEWLEKFCINHPNFSDDDWDFYPPPLHGQDYENVKRLRSFYEGILEYAEAVHHHVENGIVFVKFGSIGFEIEPNSTSSNDSICCHRKDISGSHDFIDFNDIMFHIIT